jgi:transposase
MQLTVRSILNRVLPLKGFIYEDVRSSEGRKPRIEVRIRARHGHGAVCSGCHQAAPTYDHLPVRRFWFVPLWRIAVVWLYAMRRVDCPRCGVKVEEVPWACGKRQMTLLAMQFLAGWARRMSWREVARCFGSSWQAVHRSVQWIVGWGLDHRRLTGISALGIDEIHWGKGKGANRFLTLVYQLDAGAKRLLWVGRKRTKATLRRFLREMGPSVCEGIGFVCSDMWKAYLEVVRVHLPKAVQILDPFHLGRKLNEAVDAVRRQEVGALRRAGKKPWLTDTRWILLRRWKNLRGGMRETMKDLLRRNLRTVRAYLLKEDFACFWKYKSVKWARIFLEYWTERALRSRLEPMRAVARTLRAHETLLYNWFTTRKQWNSAAVEGFNNKIRVVTRRSYGFRTYKAMELALYHTLGALPEPPVTHRFW